MTLPGYYWDRWPYFAGKLSWDITTTQVNSALHPYGVAKSSTSFGRGKGGKVTSAGWQVTLCDLIWHVISRSGVVISITNCYISGLLYFTVYKENFKSAKTVHRPKPRSTNRLSVHSGSSSCSQSPRLRFRLRLHTSATARVRVVIRVGLGLAGFITFNLR